MNKKEMKNLLRTFKNQLEDIKKMENIISYKGTDINLTGWVHHIFCHIDETLEDIKAALKS